MPLKDINTILQNLCIYDQRNPDFNYELKPEKCYCDNCFYGRHDLAVLVIDCLTTISILKRNQNGTQNPS